MITKQLPLIQRYTNLKNRLGEEIELLNEYRKMLPNDCNAYKHYTRQIYLYRETIDLLEDIFNGEDEDLR